MDYDVDEMVITNGSKGSGNELTTGVSFDYAEFEIEVDETITELVLYSTVYQAKAGFTVIDEKGNTIISGEPFEDMTDDMASLEIHIALEVSKAQTLTVVYYKGGSGTGNAGLAAIAVK